MICNLPQTKISLVYMRDEIIKELYMLDNVKSWLKEIAEVGLLIIAVAVVLELIFGSAVPFIGIGILDNITALTAQLGSEGLVGIITIGLVVWLYMRR